MLSDYKKRNCHQKLGKTYQGRQKKIKKNKLGRRNSKKQLKIFKFEDKIPDFIARLLALITFIQVFDGNSFF
jgi:hypothetical protein